MALFSGGLNGVVRIDRRGISIYLGWPFRTWRAEFPTAVVVNLEVVDRKVFRDWLMAAWQALKAKNPAVVILLGDDVIFKKVVSWTGGELQQFWDEVPLPPSKVSRFVQGGEGLKIEALATNKELYEVVRESVVALGGRVEAVVPVARFPNLSSSQKWGEKEVKEILSTSDWAKIGSFLTGDVEALVNRSQGGGRNWGTTAVLALLLLVVGTGLVQELRKQQTVPIAARVVKPSATATPLATKSPLPVASPSATPISRAAVKIEVLNGGGLAGAAAAAKEYLESKGYLAVAVGNATVSGLVKTEVAVKASESGIFTLVSRDLAGKYLVATPAGQLGPEASYDAVVTLGSQ